MQRLRAAIVSLGFSTVVLACSSSATPDDPCASLAAAICSKADECSKVFVASLYTDLANCKARRTLTCVDALRAPGTGWTAALVSSCSRDYGAASCDTFFSAALDERCGKPSGMRADGAPCGDDGQCSSANCQTKATTCGVCAARVGAGAACLTSGDCQTGLSCRSSLCVPLGAAGSTCDADHPCPVNLACLGGTCASPLPLGAPCAAASDCGIVGGAVCNPTTKVCSASEIASPGKACGVVGDRYVSCGAGGWCQPNAGSIGGATCVAPAADGKPCSPIRGVFCVSPAICVADVCELPDATSCH